jgi:hypothetical protein
MQSYSWGKVNISRGDSIGVGERKKVHMNMSLNSECLPKQNWLNTKIRKYCEW